jgi:Cu2+-exporting ATPase
MKVAEIALHTCFDGTELASVEPWLASQPGVITVAIDRTRSVAHVCYDPEITSLGTVCRLLDRHGYACDGADQAGSHCQPGHPAAGRADQTSAP